MEQVLYNRFVNTSGTLGHNISVDLHMEHLNRDAKDCIIGLGSGKTENTIIRLEKAIGTVTPVLNQFDKANDIKGHHSQHKIASIKKDLCIIVNHIKSTKSLAL
jgi:L1 cell adhesion molecule like protein